MKFLCVVALLSLTARAAEDGGVVAEANEPGAVTKAKAAIGHVGDGLREVIPEAWLRPAAFGLQRWQWLGVPLLAALIFLLTLLLVRLTAAVVRRVRRDQNAAEQIVKRLSGPLKLAWGSLLARLAVPLLGLTRETEDLWSRLFRVGLTVALFWGALNAVSAWSDNFATSNFAQAKPGSRALVSLLARVARFALAGFAILAGLSELGYSVTSVLAGLGIGGIALALGAQKTLENVFGAFALAIDQPIREGDFVRIDDFVGTVETIGLRSTRIRTLDRTMISIPNGKLAEMRLETFAARDRIRLQLLVRLSYGTTTDQLKKVMEGIRQLLEARKELWPEGASVNLIELAQSSLDVEIACWFATADFDEFKLIREELLLQILQVVEASGTSIAFPTRTLHLLPGKEPGSQA